MTSALERLRHLVRSRIDVLRPLLPDANDDLVLEAALGGHADLLVTFNRRDFQIAESAWGVLVVTPQEALKQMRRTDEKE